MDILALIVWLIIGAAAGLFAGEFIGAKRPYGIIGELNLGVLGAIFGGYIIGAGASGKFGTFVTALVSALLLIRIPRKFKRI